MIRFLGSLARPIVVEALRQHRPSRRPRSIGASEPRIYHLGPAVHRCGDPALRRPIFVAPRHVLETTFASYLG